MAAPTTSIGRLLDKLKFVSLQFVFGKLIRTQFLFFSEQKSACSPVRGTGALVHRTENRVRALNPIRIQSESESESESKSKSEP